MRIKNTDILSDKILDSADAICFTSNGIVKKDGSLVMGAGNALAFKQMFPGLDNEMGKHVSKYGNKPCPITGSLWSIQPFIINFPTKHHYRDSSDLKLIENSAKELVRLANVAYNNWHSIYTCPPGVGLGGLDWDNQVKPLLENIFDDRFIICFKE